MSTYNDLHDYLQFPETGRSVRNCRKDAKRLRDKTSVKLSACLDQVGRENGSVSGWNTSLRQLMDASIRKVSTQQPIMSLDDLQAVANRNRLITQWGVGVWDLAVVARGAASGDELLKTEHDTIHFLLPHCNDALVYIRHLTAQRKVNTNRTLKSNELKHHVEHTFKRLGWHTYIPHGAFILAALYMGFLPQRCSRDSLSVYFNISDDSPILKWDGDLHAPVAARMLRHIEYLADPVRAGLSAVRK